MHSKLAELDESLLRLLEERARLAVNLANAQRAAGQTLFEPDQERVGIEELEQAQLHRAHAVFPATAVGPVFREIVSACRSIQTATRVAYLGPPGSFCQNAAIQRFGQSVDFVDCTTIGSIFELVENGEVDYGVAPIENSIGGSVSATLDQLIERQVQLRGELILKINQCLVARHAEFTRIQFIHSHPQGLSQCRRWLAEHLPHAELVVAPSTSAAAYNASRDESIAAVASALAAKVHGLMVVQSGIQDESDNATRFVVLAKSDAPASGRDRTSLVFSTPHERGALRRALEVFDEEGINLSRIESRPGPGKLWEYVFFTDLEGHRADESVARAIERLSQSCAMVRVLGSYPRAH